MVGEVMGRYKVPEKPGKEGMGDAFVPQVLTAALLIGAIGYTGS